jgi:hypothetical protein
MVRRCAISGSKIPTGHRLYSLNQYKTDLLIQRGYLSRKDAAGLSKGAVICSQHFNFPSKVEGQKSLSKEKFRQYLKECLGQAKFTCGNQSDGRLPPSHHLHQPSPEVEDEILEEVEDEILEEVEDEILEEEKESTNLEEDEELIKMLNLKKDGAPAKKLSRFSTNPPSSPSTSIASVTRVSSKSKSLDVLPEKTEKRQDLLDLLTEEEVRLLLKRQRDLKEENYEMRNEVSSLSCQLQSLSTTLPLTWGECKRAGLLEIVTGHSESWIVKNLLDPLESLLLHRRRGGKVGGPVFIL